MKRPLAWLFGAVILSGAAGAGGGYLGVEYGLSHARGASGLDEVLHRDLSLSAGQNASLERLEADFAVKKAAREAEMRAANRDLAAALTQRHAFGPEAEAAIGRFHTSMAALQGETIEHVIAMRALLTPAQAAKFDRVVSETLAAPDR